MGGVAEWLRSGLQIRVHRFKSGHHLQLQIHFAIHRQLHPFASLRRTCTYASLAQGSLSCLARVSLLVGRAVTTRWPRSGMNPLQY